MVYEASVRGEMSSVLSAAFVGCEVAAGRGMTTVRFSPGELRDVLDRIQDFGLVLIDLRLQTEPGADPIGRVKEGDPRSANGEIVYQRIVEISVKGEVDPSSIEGLDDVAAITDRGVTRLRAAVRDDSTLYGLLERLQAYGLEVLAVYPCAELPPAPAHDRSPGGR